MLAASEGSSSRNLGEYAVSARSDLRSAANYTYHLSFMVPFSTAIKAD